MTPSRELLTGARTSGKQVPAILRLVNAYGTIDFWRTHSCVLDIGGGKYDLLTGALKRLGATNWVLDPYNRTARHNERVEKALRRRPADAVLCSNVLNVVRSSSARRDIHAKIKALSKHDAVVFFTVYEGDKSSVGRFTTKGWQANRPTRHYIPELNKEYSRVEVFRSRLVIVTGF